MSSSMSDPYLQVFIMKNAHPYDPGYFIFVQHSPRHRYGTVFSLNPISPTAVTYRRRDRQHVNDPSFTFEHIGYIRASKLRYLDRVCATIPLSDPVMTPVRNFISTSQRSPYFRQGHTGYHNPSASSFGRNYQFSDLAWIYSVLETCFQHGYLTAG